MLTELKFTDADLRILAQAMEAFVYGLCNRPVQATVADCQRFIDAHELNATISQAVEDLDND